MNIKQILQQDNFSNIVFKGIRLTHFDEKKMHFLKPSMILM